MIQRPLVGISRRNCTPHRLSQRVHLQGSSARYSDGWFVYCGPGGFAEVPHQQWSCCSLVRSSNHQPSGFALLLACHPARGLQARHAMLACGSCWIPRAGFTRVLFAFHRFTPLAPATSVLTGADKAKRITRRNPHKTEMQRLRGNEVALGPATLSTLMLCSWMKRRSCASAFLHTTPICPVGGTLLYTPFVVGRKR